MVDRPSAVCAVLLVTVLAVFGQMAKAGETLLLDFTAKWCGPCRAMEPTVQRLVDEGFRVRKIDIDEHRDLADRYQVANVPCFVMLDDGREVDRAVGMASYERLAQMCRRPDAAENSARTGPRSGGSFEHCTVRIRVADAQGQSYGTGTIISTRGDEALVLTCGHLFRESQGTGPILVDLFGPGAPQRVPGRLLGYDLDRDLGLVVIRPGVPVSAARVAGPRRALRQAEPVVTLGCPNGQGPLARPSRVTAIDRYQGPSNTEVSGMPVEGCSGGGLFDREGYLVGVCFAADAKENAGLYAGLASIHTELDRLGLHDVYASQPPPSVAAAPVPLPRDYTPADQSDRSTSTRISPAEQATLAKLRQPPRGTEVICIIRPADPQAASQVVVLDNVSPQWLEQLTETSRRASHQLTSMDVPSR